MNLSTIPKEKKKYIRGNNKPFNTKVLSKPIMEKSSLRNTFLKNPTVGNKLGYTKQRNFSVSLLRIVKRQYFTNLNEKNNIFGKLPSFFSLRKIKGKITLVKNEEIISDDVEVANNLNNYFFNVAKNLKISEKSLTESLHQSLSR